MKWTDKPGSVENDHSSRRTITHTLKRPTRIQYGPYLRIPIWSCFWWGLPCHELLPAMRCALTAPFHPYLQFLPKKKPHEGGLLSAALSVGSRRPGVTWHPALWSPDFPPLLQSRRPPQQRPSSPLRGAYYQSSKLIACIFLRCQFFIFFHQLVLWLNMIGIKRNTINWTK